MQGWWRNALGNAMPAKLWLGMRACAWLCLGLWLHPAWAQAAAQEVSQHCTVPVPSSFMAPETVRGQRPTEGWRSVTLPRSIGHDASMPKGPVWFRVQWQLSCAEQKTDALGVFVAGIHQAGEVYWNDQLLWRSRSQVDPLSRGGNTPRWWPVWIADAQQPQTLWVRVVSDVPAHLGLGQVELGDAQEIEALQQHRFTRQRTGYVVSGALGFAIACVALVVWVFHRREKSYFWLGCMQVFWVLYLSILLAQETWLLSSANALTGVSLSFLLLYAQCFLMFTLRFGGVHYPMVEKSTWGALTLWLCLVLWVGVPSTYRNLISLAWCGLLFTATSLYFQWHTWRTRNPLHMMLAMCWLGVLVVGVHDTWFAMQQWYNFETWTVFFGPVLAIMLGVLLGWKLAADMRHIDGFNAELKQKVAEAENQLAQSLAREHAQALQHAKVQERMQLAHDLHDGLGGTLVRSMSIIEASDYALEKGRVLSMLKSMRDDLRQIIDAGSGSGAQVPQSPTEWLAPLRHRVMRVLESLDVQARWEVDAHWQQVPSATQCLSLLRILEESFANIIKHSQAQHVHMRCTQSAGGLLHITLQDDGVGFDMQAVQAANLSVGMRSMQARAQRMGAHWQVISAPTGTVVEVQLQVSTPHPAQPVATATHD